MGRGDVHIIGYWGGPLCGGGGGAPTSNRQCQECVWAEDRQPLPPISKQPTTAPSDTPVLRHVSGDIDVSVILGTVRRPKMLQACIQAVRAGLVGSRYTYEIIVAYGEENDESIPWLREQVDCRLVAGGMSGAIDAINRAYAASKGRIVCQINDDVEVDAGSIALAVNHIDRDPTSAGVVFQFDRGDGAGLRTEKLSNGAAHPNQLVARRSTCEAVVETIGAFWGDEAHRTDKTYGGDSAFGVVCSHLGLRLDVVQGVSCKDRQNEAIDFIRAKNSHLRDGHFQNWHRMYDPMLRRAQAVVEGSTPADLKSLRAEALIRRLRAIDPTDGHWPARAVAALPERVLHVHLETADDQQAGLVRALQKLGAAGYSQVAWPNMSQAVVERAIVEAATLLRPTLVFMQLQTPNIVSPAVIARVREVVNDPRLVVVTWCGDVAGRNSPWDVEWQVPLGCAVDLTLHSSFTHVKALRTAGIERAAYLQIGYDEEQYQPAPGTPREHDICFLGNRYYTPDYLSSMREHDADLREAVILAMLQAFSSRFGLYGSGHAGGLGQIALRDAHAAYHRSAIGLNVSLCNFFDAYSSDRIFRILGCGSALLTKHFPMMSVYGLRDGENCLVWDTPQEAVSLAQEYLRTERAADLAAIAKAGAVLARERHTWDARMHELAPLIAAVRGEMWS